ncbi:MAG: tetratricopeptide repeat protein [Chloroflexi bacterium]|nr:tetratricopeptide repeat protein [Chloroflexota bacterium]
MSRVVSQAPADRARAGRLRGLGRLGRLRRLWYPLAAIVVVIVGFFLFGPPSSPSTASQLARMAPAFAPASGPVTAPAGASLTEQEIAKQYEAARQNPESVTAYVQLGNAYVQHVRQTGDPTDYGRAEAAFDAALRRSPDSVDAIVGKGVLSLARHEFAQARELGARAVSLAPTRSRVYGVLLDANTELGRYEEALASAQQMIDLRPDFASYSRVSYQRELHGQMDGAISSMQQAFESSVGSEPEAREYLRVLLGDLSLRTGDLKAAGATYEASLAVLPNYVWAEAGLARVRAAEGRTDESIALWKKIVDQLPLPEFVVASGETKEAVGLLDDARKDYALAEAIQQLFAENGVNVDLDLALFRADHGSDPKAAVDLARKAYAQQPNVKAADALGWALHAAGSFDEARKYADEALRLGTPYGQFLYHAGIIAKSQGDTAAAKMYLTRALELDPYFSPLFAPRARQALTELGG